MCIKVTTTTHLRSRWGRVGTVEGVWWGLQTISTMPVVTTLQVLLPQQYLGQIPRFSVQ